MSIHVDELYIISKMINNHWRNILLENDIEKCNKCNKYHKPISSIDLRSYWIVQCLICKKCCNMDNTYYKKCRICHKFGTICKRCAMINGSGYYTCNECSAK